MATEEVKMNGLLLNKNNKENNNVEKQKLAQNDCIICCYNKNKKEWNNECPLVKNFLKPLLLEINNKLQEIKDMNLDKYTKQDLLKCYNIIEEKGYINKDLIELTPELKTRYTDREHIHYLFKYLLREYHELTSFNAGIGGKKWICKKNNEKEIRRIAQKLSKEKKKKNVKTKISETQNISSYLQEQYPNMPLSIEEFRRIFRTEFDIKSPNKVEKILRHLSKEGEIENLGIGVFRVLSQIDYKDVLRKGEY